eukprot:s2497_g12.t1
MSTTAFPLPAPDLQIFAGGGPNLSKRMFQKVARARVLHILVMVINYLYLGRFPSEAEIGRRANEVQCQIFNRLRLMLAVCGASREPFPLCPGRSGPQLASSLMHLEKFAESCKQFSDGYQRVRTKDVEAEDFFRAAGAEIDSRPSATRNGYCVVSAPFAKRFALSALSLRAATLPSISPLLAARLSGNWVSALLYRRCIAAVVDQFFALSAGLEKPDAERVVPLTRRCAEELTLLAALAPLMSANVAAEFQSEVYVSDASIQKGAVVSGHVSAEVSRALWQSSEKKGHYTLLERPVRGRLKELVEELELPEDVPTPEAVIAEGPYKAPLLEFDFVEICGGAGVLSKQAAMIGLVVAPVLDLSESPHYDLRGLRFLEWICYMVSSGRFRSFLIEPPCTSFSAAAHPAVRSYDQPLGFDRCEKKTLHGNTLSFRSFTILKLERQRAALRQRTFLPADRVIRKETRTRRIQLLNHFRTWLWKNQGVSLRALLGEKFLDAERISHWLVVYGREMYAAGKSYGRFSETINSIAMTRPLLKKQLTPAWDLCFSWLADEPHQHHPALPASILLAMLTICLMWGWPYEASVLALTWAGVCRIGEVLQATRDDLILPQDSAPGTFFVLLRIGEPKTRGRAARHQSARVDQEDIIRLLIAVYGKCDSTDKLWPLSAATLRGRFTTLLKALDLPTDSAGGARCFDLSSLRPGGATYILNMTENTELVRRRGRWLSQRVCDVYLQEVQVATYLHRLTGAQRGKILQLARGFSNVLNIAIRFLNTGIPPKAWYPLMKTQRDQGELCPGGLPRRAAAPHGEAIGDVAQEVHFGNPVSSFS